MASGATLWVMRVAVVGMASAVWSEGHRSASSIGGLASQRVVAVPEVRLEPRLGAKCDAGKERGRGNRSARVSERDARDLCGAALAFNDMQARIARFEAECTRTFSAVGHDLHGLFPGSPSGKS